MESIIWWYLEWKIGNKIYQNANSNENHLAIDNFVKYIFFIVWHLQDQSDSKWSKKIWAKTKDKSLDAVFAWIFIGALVDSCWFECWKLLFFNFCWLFPQHTVAIIHYLLQYWFTRTDYNLLHLLGSRLR